jgi:uncharacterized membrane protein HdeD (DUF308 family)
MSASVPYTPETYPADVTASDRAGAPGDSGGLDSAEKLAWWVALGAALLGLVVGVMMMAWPEATLKVVAVLFGLYLLLHGLGRLVQAIAGSDETGGQRAILAVVGVVFVIAGVIALRNLLASLSVLATIIGLMWLIGGIVEVATAFAGPGGGIRLWRVVLGSLSVVAALVILVWPDLSLVTLVYITAAWLIVMGLLQVAMVLWARRTLSAPAGSTPGPRIRVTS